MHGLVFSELRKYVVAKLGEGQWDVLVEEAGLAGKVFRYGKTYPDDELRALVIAASRVTGSSVSSVMEDFGEFIVPDLFDMFGGSLIEPNWKTLDLIEHTEAVIHAVVRMHTVGAQPPHLVCARTGPDEVVVDYVSARRMCALLKGIARGVAKHYCESIAIGEGRCMLKGDDVCQIKIRVVPTGS